MPVFAANEPPAVETVTGKNYEGGREFDPRSLARTLLRTIRSGTLATLDADGYPFGSLVTVATDFDGAPLLFLSRLAVHTGNLDRDERASLLLARGRKGDPLAHPRLTLVGRIRTRTEPRHRRRFLARHPKAQLYADFPDFGFRRMEIERVHLNGGFARAATLGPGDLLADMADAAPLIEAEESAVAHMNADHADAVRLYATVLAGAPYALWQLSGLDPEGMDLMAGDLTARVAFPERVGDHGSVQTMLVRLAAEARGRSEPAATATET